MKFDTVIIGGGLSGLICGIRLVQEGQRCAIVSSGQSALHFSSGSFDLMNRLPNGDVVTNPLSSVKSLMAMYPDHPYSKLGVEVFTELAYEAESFLGGIGLSMKGSANKNHYRITPLGTLKPTWLSTLNLAVSDSESSLPWKKVSIFNISGFLDFYPRFLADEFAQLGVKSETFLFSLPDLDHLRRNPSELRATNITRILDKDTNVKELVNIFKKASSDSDAIIFPACLGLKDSNVLEDLQRLVEKPIYMVPTLPPSVIGIHAQQYMHDYFIHLGGVYMLGDTIKKCEIEGDKVKKIYSYNHGDIPFMAKNVVLATGSYFSQGLIASREKIYEPIFDLDVNYMKDRPDWYDRNIFESQNYQSFGVKTTATFNALKQGMPLENLYVSGAILDGFNPIKEGSGAGVSILSALYIANRIIKKEGGI
ncbi:glycerol-3-phosphate dehydrogenase subunit GlpB [Dysgonomonas sp. Marseille-P4677]|uniref:glycerol-3-phosphate dehydrogenase subunit GlpB n=1 Tax=Dysgonomonas sp. Marseille-P4677 TaxID=2364790 RepID=UPI0019121ADC|nr:glycerol-3-phosphate dehydrogenase subunit GlpB [Dysgonomonas sp. Marseille-P4677]MBK5720034.1 glycerol-3-phosphate dehydrogenase subunit GlpB [Dysgonomonas sp. Marseille-P4677]